MVRVWRPGRRGIWRAQLQAGGVIVDGRTIGEAVGKLMLRLGRESGLVIRATECENRPVVPVVPAARLNAG